MDRTCPFCGSIPKEHGSSTGWWGCFNPDCPVQPHVQLRTVEESKGAWNVRSERVLESYPVRCYCPCHMSLSNGHCTNCNTPDGRTYQAYQCGMRKMLADLMKTGKTLVGVVD